MRPWIPQRQSLEAEKPTRISTGSPSIIGGSARPVTAAPTANPTMGTLACHFAPPLAILPIARFAGSISSPARTALARELYTARLARKDCISEFAQCYHFEFVLDGLESFPYAPGQFISAVAPDQNGKMQTRAYSIASAANTNRFELCINRVEEGFFSNHLADLPDLPVRATIQVHGPHRSDEHTSELPSL